MKQTFYSALGILLLGALAEPALAQTTARTQTYIPLNVCPSTPGTDVADYYNPLTTSGNFFVEKRTAKEVFGNTSFQFSNYSSTVSGANPQASTYDDAFGYTNIFNSQVVGNTFVWRQNSTNTHLGGEQNQVTQNSPYKSQVTITFSREVKNLKITFQDIDKALLSQNQGSNFTDEVDLYPTNAAGQPTDISGTLPTTGAPDNGKVQVGYGLPNSSGEYGWYGNIGTPSGSPSANNTNDATCKASLKTRPDNTLHFVFQGVGLNGGAAGSPSRAGNATVVFKNPVKQIVLTYSNLYTIDPNNNCTDLRLQTIAIENISWCTVTTLPVTLTGFDAKTADSDARLTWATASETDNDYFGVERSFDGVSFTSLGKVAGHGTTNTFSNYTYNDAGVAAKATGPVYYRLRQVNLDGTSTYSPVRTVAFEKGAAAIKMYPNPATPNDNQLTLDLLTLPQGEYQASLINVLGSKVATYTVRGGETQPLALPTSLAPGTYIMTVQGQGVHLTQRLARQ